MNAIILIKVMIFIGIINTIFSGIMIFLMITAANKAEEVRDTLKNASQKSVEKMDSLAKEETLQQLKERSDLV